MKLAATMFALVFASAFSAAGEAAASAAGQCAVPKIPAVSTSQAGADRIHKQLKEWNACVASGKADPALVENVNSQAKAWAKATELHSQGQGKGANAQSIDDRAKQAHQDNIRADQRAARPQAAQDAH